MDAKDRTGTPSEAAVFVIWLLLVCLFIDLCMWYLDWLRDLRADSGVESEEVREFSRDSMS